MRWGLVPCVGIVTLWVQRNNQDSQPFMTGKVKSTDAQRPFSGRWLMKSGARKMFGRERRKARETVSCGGQQSHANHTHFMRSC